jgi:hypothetical protein
MRQHFLVSITMVMLLVGTAAVVFPVHAQPASENNVEATLSCSFDSGGQLTVRARMVVNRISVFDAVYDQQEIEGMAGTNPYVMGAIMLVLHESVKTQISTAFPHAVVDAIRTIPSYETPYFIDDFQVNLTPAFFNSNGSLNLTRFITGMLDMSAIVTYHFDLQAEQGWNTTFVFVLPSTTMLSYANTADTNPDMNTATWMVRNWEGNDTGKDATISLQAKNPTTPASDADDIALEFLVDTQTVNNINFIETVVVKKVNVHQYNVLPSFITGLGSIPADGVRLCIDNGLFSWKDLLENTVSPIEQETIPLLENSSLKQNLQFSFSWDPESTTNCSTPYNITAMDDAPAIRATFTDPSIDLKICQMPARAFFGLIDAGATASITSADVNIGNGLETIRYPYDIILRLPINISLNGDNVYTWNRTTPISGVFTSGLQPTPAYTAEHVETRVEIELLKMDLNIFSLLTGKTELTASTKMKEDEWLYVIHRTADLSFSPKVNISYLNADALRLCIEENVFDESQVSAFLTQKTEAFQLRLSEIFPGTTVKGAVDRKLFSSSLGWDGDIATMDNVTPVIVSNYANEVYSVRFNMSLWPAELTITPQRFTLQGGANQSVIYRIIFPRGLTVNASDSAGKPLITGKTNDGRDYVEVSFDGASASQSTVLSCVLNVSPVYVLGLFLPCLLVFVLLIVLVVIIYLIRKKKGGLRHGKRKLFEPEDNEPGDYGGQDYYVPPPPSSKKKK